MGDAHHGIRGNLGGEWKMCKCVLCCCTGGFMTARPSLCRSRQKAERCSFTATFEGGCYEVSEGSETQV
jgi:hypothetical protein